MVVAIMNYALYESAAEVEADNNPTIGRGIHAVGVESPLNSAVS